MLQLQINDKVILESKDASGNTEYITVINIESFTNSADKLVTYLINTHQVSDTMILSDFMQKHFN